MSDDYEDDTFPSLSETFKFNVDGNKLDLMDMFDQEILRVIYDFMNTSSRGRMSISDVIRALSIGHNCSFCLNDNYKYLQSYIVGFMIGAAEYGFLQDKRDKFHSADEIIDQVIAKICADTGMSKEDIEIIDCFAVSPSLKLSAMVDSNNKEVIKFYFKMFMKSSQMLKEDDGIASLNEISALKQLAKNGDIRKSLTDVLIRGLKHEPKYKILQTFYSNDDVIKTVKTDVARKIGEIFNVTLS